MFMHPNQCALSPCFLELIAHGTIHLDSEIGAREAEDPPDVVAHRNSYSLPTTSTTRSAKI